MDRVLAEVRAIREDTHQVRESVSELTRKTDRLADQHTNWGARFDRVEQAINGEGATPGLRMQVDRNQRDLQEVRGTIRGVTKAVIGIASGAAIALMNYIRSKLS